MEEFNIIRNKDKFINDTDSLTIRRNIDVTQNMIMSYIGSHLFPWLCLVLFLNRKDWKRPVILILILYWFLQSTGDVLQCYMKFSNIDYYDAKKIYWPYTIKNWYISNATAYLFWESGEIIADWYPLLRTKALVQNNRKIKPIYYTCILYNIVKAILIAVNFIFVPTTLDQNDTKFYEEMLKYKIIFWWVIVAIQIISFIYDILVMLALKNNLFDKLETLKQKSSGFLEKFKQISEFRIFISLIISIIFLPCAIYQVCLYIYLRKYQFVDARKMNDPVEFLRILILRFVYSFMYIDQILLRFYIKKNKANYIKMDQSNYTSNQDSPIDSQLIINTSMSKSTTLVNPSPATSVSSVYLNTSMQSLIKNNNHNEQDISKPANHSSMMMNQSPILINHSPLMTQSRREVRSTYYLKRLSNLENKN